MKINVEMMTALLLLTWSFFGATAGEMKLEISTGRVGGHLHKKVYVQESRVLPQVWNCKSSVGKVFKIVCVVACPVSVCKIWHYSHFRITFRFLGGNEYC